jgi:succinoglycan biosynthesis transport protein ExoP
MNQQLMTGAGRHSTRAFLRDLADRLFRKKRFVAVSLLLVNLGFAGYLAFSPRIWETEAKFLVNNTRVDALLTPESSNGPVARNYVDETVLATEIQLLSNPELLRSVVVKCGLAKDGRDVSIEKALKSLKQDITVSPVLKANLIKASYSASDPQEAAAVLQALADGYLDEHLRVHSSQGSYDVFDRQAKHYQEQLGVLQTKLNEFQQQRNIVLLGQQKDLNLRKMVDLEGALKETEAAYRENDQRIHSLKQQVKDLMPRITTQARQVPNQYSIERLNTMLAELQNKRTELLTKFRDNDRMVQQLDQQIADTKANMEKANKMISTEESSDVNPVRQTLESELAKAQASAPALQSRLATLTRQVGEYRQSLGGFQHATADDDQLLREIKEAEDSFFLYSKKREEARIGDAMDRQKIANVVLVEPPRVPVLPRPKLSLSLIATDVLCCAFILGTALLMGAASKTVYTPRELEDLTGLPVLASYSLRPVLLSGPRLEPVTSQEYLR